MYKNLSGKDIGYLHVIEPTEKRTKKYSVVWRCLCTACGNECEKTTDALRDGKNKHCGCLGQEGRGKPSKHIELIKKDNYYIGKTTNTNKEFYIDEEDYDLINKYNWYENETGYALSRINNHLVRMHRLIMNPPDNMCIDHINHNTLDNRKSNLRICSKGENARNRYVEKGYNKKENGRFEVILRSELGNFFKMVDTEEEAKLLRKQVENEIYGEFSYENSMAGANL